MFEAALSSTFCPYLLSKKVFLPLFGTNFIYGQRFLMAVFRMKAEHFSFKMKVLAS